VTSTSPDGSYFAVIDGRSAQPALRHRRAVGDRRRARSAAAVGGELVSPFSALLVNPSPDTAGPGAVAREGIVALDPLNGLPFSWNPTHERGVGVFTMPATARGLWAGSDTDHAGGEFHQKIALFPTEGGSAPPPVVTYTLPNDLYNMDQATGALNRRSYDLSTFGATASVPTGVDWRDARGAFMVSGSLYYGMSDGRLYTRTFDGATLGAATQVNLNGLEVQPPSAFTIPGTTTRVPSFATDLASMTGMFYDNGRIYYTVNRPGILQTTNNNKLYYRYFNPESNIVGANLFVASSYPADAEVQWANVRGMTLASGTLIYASPTHSTGRLGGTKPTGPAAQIGGATTAVARCSSSARSVTRSHRPRLARRAGQLDVRFDRPLVASPTDNFPGPSPTGLPTVCRSGDERADR
jgi:hypothetical protein